VFVFLWLLYLLYFSSPYLYINLSLCGCILRGDRTSKLINTAKLFI
jgi:hypothetical protein